MKRLRFPDKAEVGAAFLRIGRHPLTLLCAAVPPAAFPDQLWLVLGPFPILLTWHIYAVSLEPLTAPRRRTGIRLSPSVVLDAATLARHRASSAQYLAARGERRTAQGLLEGGDHATSETVARLRGEDLMARIEAEEGAWRMLQSVHQPPRWERALWLALGVVGASLGIQPILAELSSSAPFGTATETIVARGVLGALGALVIALALRQFRAVPPPADDAPVL